MTFKFREGETVALAEDHPLLNLSAGDTGVVVCLYATEPPAYEVTFRDGEGTAFDCVMSEEELTRVAGGLPSSRSGAGQ